MSRPRVHFLNRFYWPDEPATAQLLADLAEGLAARGHPVSVVTSRPARPGSPRHEVRRGVSINRVRSTHWGKTNLVGRVFDFATFYLGAVWQLLLQVRRGDVVVALTDPPLIGVWAWPIARLKRAHLVHWTQDIYPEIAIALTPHRWLGALGPLRDAVWRHSARCITLGEDMATVLAGAAVPPARVVLSPNWPPAGVCPAPAPHVDALRAEWGLTGKFVLLYSGNMGRVHDLLPLLDLAEALRDVPHLAFLFIGQGAQRAELETAARQRRLDSVHFRPPQPRARLTTTLSLGDVHFVTLRPGCERYVFPSKLYGIAAVGRPMVFLGPTGCELARMVQAEGLGTAFGCDDLVAAAAHLRRASVQPPSPETAIRALAFAHRHRPAALNTWDDLIESLATQLTRK